MSADTIHLSRSASLVRFSIWIGCGVTILLLVVGVVLWFLPRWAPLWVAEHSPSFAYAWLAVQPDHTHEANGVVWSRLSHWQGEPARVVRRKLERHDPTMDIDGQELDLLRRLCDQKSLVLYAELRLSSGQARREVERMWEQGRDDLLAANLWLLGHADGYYRGIGAENLGMLGDARARVALEDHLYDDDTTDDAAKALGESGDRAAIPALVRFLQLKERGDHMPAWNSMLWLADRLTDDQVITLLTARSGRVRAEALSLVTDRRSVAILSALVRLAVDPNSRIAERSREHLRQSLAKDQLPSLVAWLRSEDVVLQRGSVIVLSYLDDARAVAPLLDLLPPDGPFVDPQVERALLANLPVDDDQVLLAGLAHSSPAVRAWVTRQIGLRGLSGSAEALLLREADPAPEVRAATLRALGMMQVREVLPRCELALTAATVEERVGAIRALGDLGERSAIALIRPHLYVSAAKERQAGAQALGQLGRREDVALQDELRLLLKDPVPTVQEAARAALEHLSLDAAELEALEQQRLLEFRMPPRNPGAAK